MLRTITLTGSHAFFYFNRNGYSTGHTAGSLSLVCEGGAACVGDLAANHLSWRGQPVLPPFFGDPAQLRVSWQRLLAAGMRRVYPGHGQPFEVTGPR
ncbi:MAG: hypothetical protein Kow0077_20450 [Anaerolineae bacterium]